MQFDDMGRLYNRYCVIDIVLSIFEYLYSAGDDVLVCDSNKMLLSDCQYDIGIIVLVIYCLYNSVINKMLLTEWHKHKAGKRTYNKRLYNRFT